MAWVKQTGGGLKDIIFLNNPEYVCTTYRNSNNYTKIETTMNYGNYNGYNSGYTDTPLVDITKYKKLVITGSCYNRAGQQQSGNNVQSHISLVNENGTETVLVSGGATWEQGATSYAININRDITNLTGKYRIRIFGNAWRPNYVQYSFTKVEFDKA